jgi:hypothetical protein
MKDYDTGKYIICIKTELNCYSTETICYWIKNKMAKTFTHLFLTRPKLAMSDELYEISYGLM